MTLKMQQRSVVRYYCLLGKTNRQICAKLAKGYGREALHERAVERWAARFRDGQETVEDNDRPGRPPKSDFAKALVQFLEKQPHSSTREISKALCAPRTTIRRVLASLGLHFFAPRWIPNRLSDDQKADRVALSQEMLEILEPTSSNKWRYVITEDESWIYRDNNIRGMWAHDRDEIPRSVRHSVCSKKTMISVYFSRYGFESIEYVRQGQNYNSEFFADFVLTNLEYKLAIRRPKLRAKNVYLHVDNARPHTAKRSIARIEELHFKRLPHPPYSPDIAPCDFYLFGYLKEKLHGRTFFSDDEVISAVERVLKEIPIEVLCSVMEDWTRRLNQVIELAGDYLP
jgi:transposase